MSTILTNTYRLANGAVCVHLLGAAEESRIPVHFVAVIDDSGSMGEDSKLERVVQSLEALLTYMGDDDMLSLVIFESSVKRPFTNCATTSDNKELVRAYLRTLRPLGGTNIASAIVSLHDVLRGVPGGYKTGVLFLTDGEATSGVTDEATLLVHIQTLLDTYAGTTISSIGYGHDHRADLLRGISVRGGGSYTIVTSVEQVAGAFGDLLGGLRSCVAQEVKLLVPAHATQMSAYNRREGYIFLGDLLAGGEHIVVLQNIADTDSLVVQASDIRTGAPFIPRPLVLGLANEEVGMRAYMRCAVVTLMERVNRNFQGRHLDVASTLAEIDRISRQIEALPPHPLLDILQGQLVRLRAFAIIPPPVAPSSLSRMHSNILSQNTTSLGTARGVLSPTDEDPTGISIFATSTQRTISSGMSAVVHEGSTETVNPSLPSTA